METTKLHQLVRISKRRRYKEKFEQTQGNIRKTWNLINEVINKQKTYKNLPNLFIYKNNEITDPHEIANKFNEYFANGGSKLTEKILPSSLTFESFSDDQSNCESFFINPGHHGR